MEIVEYFIKEWQVIVQAPVTFIVAALLLAGAAYAASSWRYAGIIEKQRAEIAFLERKVAESPGGVDHENRKTIMNRLGEFLTQGNKLMAESRKYDQPPPTAAAYSWYDELESYLRTNLAPAYVDRVNDGASAPIGFMSQYREHDELRNFIRIRVYHIREFMKELARV